MGLFNLFKPKKGSKKSKRKAPAKKAGAKRTSSTSRKTVSRNSKMPGPLIRPRVKVKIPMTSLQTAQELTSSKSSGKAKEKSLSWAEARKKELELVSVEIKKHRDKNGGHNHVIVDDIDNNHVSVGLTTNSKKGKNATNYHCIVDPLNNGSDSFMRRQAQVSPKIEYFDPQSGLMEKNDYQRAKVYGERAKQKYIEKNNKKSNEVPNT